jgi:hypothetical protein
MIDRKGMIFVPKLCCATIPKTWLEDFVENLDNLRMGMQNDIEPHYDDKAITLLLLLRFYVNSSFQFYTNEVMLCELMGLSNRSDNRKGIMSNILKMQEDGILSIQREPDKKFFHITLDYEFIMPEKNFVVIYKQEFDNLFLDKSRDKLLLMLCCIKKFQHKQTGISFPAIETIMDSSHISKPTICKGIERLREVLHIYKARIKFNDGTYKDVNYYKSQCEDKISQDIVMNIAKKYYKNIKSITERG